MFNMIPAACHMPDISEQCDVLTPTSLLVVAFIGDGQLPKEIALSRREMVRLVDKAVHEYNLARQSLIAEVEEKQPSVIHIFGFVDHLENCLNACRRLYYFLERIKGISAVKLNRRIIQEDSKEITAVRDTLEHMAEKIDKGEIQAGEMIFLCPTEDGRSVSLGPYRLEFDRLAVVLKVFHRVAKQLLTLK